MAGLAAAPAADGTTVVLAATPSGIYRSTDGGRRWTPAGPAGSVSFAEVIAPSPSFARDHTLFAGARGGVYRSTDSGESWQQVLASSGVLALAPGGAPGNDGEYVLFAGTETDGVLRSEDAGRTWTRVRPGLLDLTVLALALSPRFEQDRTAFVGTASGLYRSRNGGASWRMVDPSAPQRPQQSGSGGSGSGQTPPADAAVQCLAVSPDFSTDRLVLAGTEADGLLRSDDAGRTWTSVAALEPRGVAALAFSTDYPTRPIIAAATEQGVAVSYDGGETWRLSGMELGPVLSLAFVSGSGGETLLAGLLGEGVARSDDAGATWAPASEGMQARLLHGLTLSSAFEQDRTLFAADLQQGVSISTDGGSTWGERNSGLVDTTVYGLAASPSSGGAWTMYAATEAGVHRLRCAESSWQPVDGGGPGQPTRVVAAGLTTILAASTSGAFARSDGEGETWRSLGQPFGAAAVITIAFSPDYPADRTIFAGTSSPTPDGVGELVLWRSRDGGERWERWLVERGADRLPLAVPPDSALDGMLFVGLGRRVVKPLPRAQEVRGGQRRPIWRSVELGDEATRVTALAVSPAFRDDRTLFAATSDGVYVSRDGGESFSRWNEGLDATSLVAVAVSPDYRRDRLVYALALGGAVWRRRDG